MVVADKKMADYHGKNISHYLLALMSIVQSIYRDASLGNSVNIVVVRIKVLHNETAGPKITSNAARTLHNFCHWQHAHNFEESNPLHHDTSVLITRENLCRSQRECATMGLAELGTMCDSPRSCAINEDNGLSAAFTIAHELGHLFSLPHDDDAKCLAFADQSPIFHVMAPTLDYRTDPWTWSACSTKMLTTFLDDGYGECLIDRPQHQQVWEKSRSPGEEFSSDKQCEFVFGPGYRTCPYMSTCARLWCIRGKGEGCRTLHMPWADGTKCATSKWCQRGKCVTKRRMVRMDGGWSSWQPYSSCSRTCGGGIKKAVRQCNKPSPRNGGQYCLGKRIKYKSCNMEECPASRQTFRDQQCSEYDGRHFNINGLPPSVRWVPKYAGIQMKDRCKLFCRVAMSSAFYMVSNKVRDGTKCGAETSDICVNGHCHQAGCDNKLNSRTRRDQCGVCGGDNSSCKQITGHYNDSEVRYGYNLVVRIPKGATNIDIQQGHRDLNNDGNDDNYLALMNSTNNFILNGDMVITAFPKIIHLMGSKLEYSGSNNVIERINGTKMIHETLDVLVLSVGKVQPPNIVYKYTISMTGKIAVRWSTTDGPMGECSHICGGERQRQVVCVREEDGLIVSDQRCEAESLHRPAPIVQVCNTHCDIRWHMVGQSECSVHCGKGMVTQRYKCRIRMVKGNKYTDDVHCKRKYGQPQLMGPCDGKCERTHWQYQPWSQCTVSCGGGHRRRDAVCVDHQGKRYSPKHCNQTALLVRQTCNEEPCPEWQHEKWTGCSVSCGRGLQYRNVWCKKGDKAVVEGFCVGDQKPKSTKVCDLEACPYWYKGLWGQCSVTCGDGLQRREVKCQMDRVGRVLNVDDSKCNAANRPQPARRCYYPPCLVPTPAATPAAPPATRSPPPPTLPVPAALSRTQWRTGSWTECSATCGQGRRERYVSCRDYDGKIAGEVECAHQPKPASTETCMHRYCGHWRTGEWTTCSRSCGEEGIERRYVTCMGLDDLGEQLSHAQCDINVKPAEERACNRQLCVQQPPTNVISISSNHVDNTYQWRAGAWGGCSSTCEGGWQRRRVVCQNEFGASNNCPPETKPDERRLCNSGPCPSWNYGDWGPCSKTCGQGTQDRVTSCQLPNGNTLMDGSCEITRRPISKQVCNLRSCPTHKNRRPNHRRRWHKGHWSSCSVTCGRGHRTRPVVCVDGEGRRVPDHECRHRKPRERRRCRAGRCPQWRPLPWGGCSVSCGRGIQKREIRCEGGQGKTAASMEETGCSNTTRPETTRQCSQPRCHRYNWKARAWSQCSVSCGSGYKERQLLCLDGDTGQKVVESRCLAADRPKTKRRCSSNPCPSRWVAGDWSQCSRTCGMGSQWRTVECRHVTREGWVTSQQVAGCDEETRPSSQQMCNYGDCTSKYHWKAERWQPCSARCGPGKSRRGILCTDDAGETHPLSRCRGDRPSRIKACERRPCYAKSCSELKRLSTIRRDGEYSLLVSGKLVPIYCSGMHTSQPAEYLTLPSGYSNNYAHVFEKRLRKPNTCPQNDTVIGQCGPKCTKSPYRRAGHTTFSRVRVNLTTLSVIGDDFKFSITQSGKRIKYASAGDCYSAARCPRGHFKVDLSETGFHVSPNAKWRNRGKDTVQQIKFSKDGQVVEGLCGGYCGTCLPSGGLQLQVKP